MNASLFIEPLDVLFLRGNKLFGDPGSYGESMVPPWPSVVSGALRSALIARKGYDFADYALGRITDDHELGTPKQPGTFTLKSFHLARRFNNGQVERLYPVPADLVITKTGDNAPDIRRLSPNPIAGKILSSAATPYLAVLPEPQRAKPQTGYWLTEQQWMTHLTGEAINASGLLQAKDLWKTDERVGIALDLKKRQAADGQLFTTQAIALLKSEHITADYETRYTVGFMAEVSGVTMPSELTLRLGGDGRAARAVSVPDMPKPVDFNALANAGRCRLIMSSPGLFSGGWKPTGVTANGQELRFDLSGVRGRLVCATVPRAEIISGFDMARRQPKPAQRVAPIGSVYWLDQLEAEADMLRKLAEQGLWSELVEHNSRRTEGFNRFEFARY